MRENSGKRWSAGFTLMEVIVSLSVLAIASAIGIAMFSRSLALGSDVRDRRAAQGIAQELLLDMQRAPAAYTWPSATDQLQEVKRADETSPETKPPAVSTTYPAGDTEIRDRYNRMKSRAYVRLPEADTSTCELTAVVSWVRAGKQRSFTLTTLAPRRLLEGKP